MTACQTTESGKLQRVGKEKLHCPTSAKQFRMGNPYRLIINDDGGRGLINWVGPLNAEQYLDAVCGQTAVA